MDNDNSIQTPRPEYPRPQLKRDKWLNLNGEWQFEIDHGKSGRARRRHLAERLETVIAVPFCPESRLSGIGYKDFMAAVWYRREVDLPDDWRGRRILLHFGAVDYEAEVWVNGISAGTHQGGYTPFTFDITKQIKNGKNMITVCAEDDNRSGLQPRGKQSSEYHSHGCDYTRTTGIWQTVWLECVNQTYVSWFRAYPDPDNEAVHLEVRIEGEADGLVLTAQVFFEGRSVGGQTVRACGESVRVTAPLKELRMWEPGAPHLYDLKLTLTKDGQPIDEVDSYFGLRTVAWRDKAIRINGKPVFQRLVLDQGFYPEGIYTAPSDEDLRRDIELAMTMGFNGARLHEKIFDPRYLYWADRLGYLVWGEHGNWGLDISTAEGLKRFLPEWLDAVQRDFNHPAIVGWCPFNETWDNFSRQRARQDDAVLRIVYEVTKALDSTRPVIDTSGNFHVVTDIFDVHDYDQNVETFAARYEPMKQGGDAYVSFSDRQEYNGQPYFVSEYGGIWWNPGQTGDKSWGYGDRPLDEGEFLRRYEGLTATLLDNPNICAFCYTQLYDVEQETNGLYTYDRKPKFDPAVIFDINTRAAAMEQESVKGQESATERGSDHS